MLVSVLSYSATARADELSAPVVEGLPPWLRIGPPSRDTTIDPAEREGLVEGEAIDDDGIADDETHVEDAPLRR